ncbi:MAG TPA: glycoside hydrolase family 92 protein, partial [Saprospiraceae bacterium]|nr:glycoside hydrolase family 92 protein [Saprospiraceae bacterium]
IADSYLKGIRGYDIEVLYEAIKKNTEHEGPMSSVGRYGVEAYNQFGYIPCDAGIAEHTARTLEYSYDDFTIWKLAEALKKPKNDVELFYKRSQNYRHVFDTTVNFMRGKNRDGSFQVPFRPDKWGDAFTEGCSWHWTWCVFHDVEGLIRMMGGDRRFTDKLDSVFIAAPTFDYSYYRSQIHEITEMLVMNMGQYAHGNQPIQHMPYLYTYAGQPWKTQYHVREIMDKLYTAAPDGLCGDEDNGQTSAWYVFSALGFYPVCPGSNQYVLGSPLFKKATLQLENGKTLVIHAGNNESDKRYLDQAIWNGKILNRNYFEHGELKQGGLLECSMSDQPNLKRGTAVTERPYSMTPVKSD